ncbi:hypothetical protein B0A48_10636 [Cryoendolithus antarcticus]|uniref:Heterokaryon incompatibility domain-containing protein n=1 Tax=Cryoendolithus antarcticus TaxID=1507870 RepID=A0A1V8SXV9_9PEZI|nr:hypothetical protein B0A48_10636 [Cryoendolithus antarcticus]
MLQDPATTDLINRDTWESLAGFKEIRTLGKANQAYPAAPEITPFLTYYLRLKTIDLGEVYFIFGATKAYSASYDVVRTAHLRRPADYDEYELAIQRDLTKAPWTVRQHPLQATSPADSTGSPSVANTASRWLDLCLDKHTLCRGRDALQAIGWYPKRLLQIDETGDRVRLILTENETPLGPYATLSHCWGSKPICVLTADNMVDYSCEIPGKVLTKTFQDAIVTARRLSIRYLWIDSLCILQSGSGSDQDWRDHATAMRSVYSRSILNISVARAGSGDEGAFATRDASSVTASHVWWQVEHQPPAVELTESFWTIRRTVQHTSAAVRMLPLYSRGWVVQERYLAPRVLHFGSDRIFWECNEEPWIDESFPDGFSCCPDYEPVINWPFNAADVVRPQLVPVVGPRTATMTSPHALWHDSIDAYTRCDLSFPDKDILVALAGIAENFGRSFSHEYVAGLFQQHLPYDLVWRHRGERSESYRAPTWSWASIDGPIDMRFTNRCPPCNLCCQAYTEVLAVHVDLVDPLNVYGQLKSAELCLRGYVIPCGIRKLDVYGTGRSQPIVLAIGQDGHELSLNDPRKMQGEAFIDTETDSLRGYTSTTELEAWCLPIFETTWFSHNLRDPQSFHEHHGLILKSGVDGKYVRMGTYVLRQRFMQATVESNRPTRDICLV